MASLMSQPAGNRARGYCSNVTLLSFCSMWPLCTFSYTHPLTQLRISAPVLMRREGKKLLWHQREDFIEKSWLTCWAKAQRQKQCFPGALPVMMFVGQKNRRVGATACWFLGRCSSPKSTEAEHAHIVQISSNLVPNVQKMTCADGITSYKFYSRWVIFTVELCTCNKGQRHDFLFEASVKSNRNQNVLVSCFIR